jgi:hypothetical protein
MWLGLWPIVEPEHSFDFAMQFVRQMNGSAAATVGTAFMFELLEFDPKGLVELGDGARKNYAATRGVLLYYCQAIRTGECFHLCDIGRVGAKLLREFLSPHVRRATARAMHLLDPFTERSARSMTQEYGDFQPLGGIRFAKRAGTCYWFAIATFQSMFGHGLTLRYVSGSSLA